MLVHQILIVNKNEEFIKCVINASINLFFIGKDYKLDI